MVDFPVPQTKDDKSDLNVLDHAVVTCVLDYLCHSKFSKPSMSQLGHGVCTLAAAVK